MFASVLKIYYAQINVQYFSFVSLKVTTFKGNKVYLTNSNFYFTI